MTPISLFFPRAVLALLVAGTLLGCATSEVRDIEPGSDAEKLTPAQSRIWYQARKFDETLSNRDAIYVDPRLDNYLKSVMERLFPEFRGRIRVSVLKSSQLNAFALPNGSIYLNLGLLARMENEAQLSMVLAHEAGHFIQQHGLRQRQSADGVAIAGIVVSVASGVPLSGNLMVAMAMSGYSQDFERAADRVGFERMLAAGYDPEQAAEVFRMMRAEVEALDISQPFLYSSHPKLSERIESTSALAREAAVKSGERGEQRFIAHIAPLRAGLLESYLEERDYKRLILILEDDKRRNDYPVYADYYLGEAYRLRNEEGDRDRCAQAYQATLKKAPDFPDTYRALGLMRMQDGEKSVAREHLQTYLTLSPDAADRGYIEGYLKKLAD